MADQYLRHEVIPPNCLQDARHIALATVAKADVLVSWNFKHVVNFQKIRGFNTVNLKMGYPLLSIQSPMEVTAYARESR